MTNSSRRIPACRSVAGTHSFPPSLSTLTFATSLSPSHPAYPPCTHLSTFPSFLSQAEEELIEMLNGCVCCTVRQDLIAVLKKLAARIEAGTLQLDGVVIEVRLPF